jgi:hypothetical protein
VTNGYEIRAPNGCECAIGIPSGFSKDVVHTSAARDWQIVTVKATASLYICLLCLHNIPWDGVRELAMWEGINICMNNLRSIHGNNLAICVVGDFNVSLQQGTSEVIGPCCLEDGGETSSKRARTLSFLEAWGLRP